MNNIIKEVSPYTSLFSLLQQMYGQISSKNDANKVYKEIYPVLESLLAQGHSFHSKEIQHLVNVLRESPAVGIKRRNFERLYLQDEYGLRRLPKDPSYFNGQGCWH
ncbi:hypothetical protein N9R79_06175 [Vibrio sp.]|nr:hypothetical protein [Vibrio sp.]